MDPIVKQMLDTIHSPSLDIHVKEEFHKLPPCEILGHTDGTEFHNAGSPASFWVIAPCGAEKFACARWVKSGTMTAYTNCKFCGGKHSNADYTYIPINMKEDS